MLFLMLMDANEYYLGNYSWVFRSIWNCFLKFILALSQLLFERVLMLCSSH